MHIFGRVGKDASVGQSVVPRWSWCKCVRPGRVGIYLFLFDRSQSLLKRAVILDHSCVRKYGDAAYTLAHDGF
jgi:hypothetical protein